MKSLKKFFAVWSVVLLAVFAVSPLKDFYREWRGYQIEFNSLVKGLPQRVKPVDIGIKQVWVEKMNRIDRCTTCHLGLQEKALREARQPFRTHPRIHHDLEEFGCTLCHEGQGQATTFTESAGKVKYWDKPMVPNAYMEASCAKCHKEQHVPQAPLLTLGRSLIEKFNCVGCHTLPVARRQWAPSLDGIGEKVNRGWLVQWLKDPRAYDQKTRMPNFLLSDEEANTLADFLMTFKTFPNAVALETLPERLLQSKEAARTQLVEMGAVTFREARCISCHVVDGKGGHVASDLGKVASKVNAQWLYNYLKTPKRLQPGVEMPRYRFNELELAGLVAYMQSEFVDYETEARPAHTIEPTDAEHGLVLFKKYNCGGCHDLRDITKADEMAPELTFIGSKNLYEIEFGKSGIEQTLPSYLFAKLKAPRIFSSAMKMPDYGFTDTEARAIVVALLGSTREPVSDEFIVSPQPPGTFAPQGAFGKLADDLACFACHTMFGRGRLLATDLSLEASQAQRKWIEAYFKVPYSLRPILTERMPNFHLSDDEIRVIADYMELVCRADSLDRDMHSDAATVLKGRSLYDHYGCQACHQLNLKGGYVGPPLDKVALRLKPGWVFAWLKHPQAFKPESIEPDNLMSDEDAEAVTEFLMTLK